MEKFGHLPTAKPPRIPLEMLVNKICSDLFLVLAGNGYKATGFQFIVQNLEDGNDEMCMSGNLKPEGLRALLTNAMGALGPEEAANESPIQ